MNRQEAITELKNLAWIQGGANRDKATEAIDMAIEALQQERPKGEWIILLDGNEWLVYCSKCKTQHYEEDLLMGGSELPKFCPDCGSYNGGGK